jgi:hypothetical protein
VSEGALIRLVTEVSRYKILAVEISWNIRIIYILHLVKRKKKFVFL